MNLLAQPLTLPSGATLPNRIAKSAMSEVLGDPAFPIGVKLNSADFQRGGFTIEESMEVARALEAAGVDLLAGTAEAPPPVSVRSRVRRLDDALQVFWFQAQIHRMGRGLDPDLSLGKWGALLLTSVLFAAIHYNYFLKDGGVSWDIVALYVFSGLFLGALRWKSGGATVPIIAHAVSNAAPHVLIVAMSALMP